MNLQRKRGALKGKQLKLGIDQDTWVSLLRRLTGKSSSLELNERELNTVLNHLNKHDVDNARKYPRQIKAIKFLWLQLGNAGHLEDPSVKALKKFCDVYTGGKTIYKCSTKELSDVIDALKGWCRREGVGMGRLT